MKPGIDRKGGSPPTSPLACAPDMQRQVAIQVAHRYGAPSPRVFGAWLDPDLAGRWLFATASHPIAQFNIDARVGGSFRFVDRRFGDVIEHTGEYLEIVPYQRLVFTLSLEQRPQVYTRVAVEIAPRKNGCVLKLTHEHVPQEHASQVEGRWTGILYGLGATLDSLSTKVHHHQE
jgi:uncharacterized protein YndB with AHSA1/START domain